MTAVPCFSISGASRDLSEICPLARSDRPLRLGKHGKRQASSSQALDGAADDAMTEGDLPARTPSPAL